ncbi:MAG: hypothetical protein DLM54_12325 [Acidimicrobiales bacterium]|nr:MAG: hypothetical protein DLM54_12325 [Acidimicrobiales bacterium]
MRSARGRPAGTDIKKAAATRNVPTVGWRKYTKALPLTHDTAVRTVNMAVPTSNIPEIRLRVITRRATAAHDQAKAAIRALRNPRPISTT